MPDIIGVQFAKAGKIYHFIAPEEALPAGTPVIVETSRGLEYATVRLSRKHVAEEDLAAPLKEIIRPADAQDHQTHLDNLRKAEEAQVICLEKIQNHGLDMKLTGAEYTFDRSKIIFYFTADGRVDFRALVKDLAAVFHTRIELRQIGVRDEAKQIGGIGICGYPLCCKRYMGEFTPVSIKMAKNQRLSLNPSNISGACGRLLCCLNYENDLYVERKKEEEKARRQAPKDPEGAKMEASNASKNDQATQIIIEEAGEPPKRSHARRPSSAKSGRRSSKGEGANRPKRRQGKKPPKAKKPRHDS